MLVDDSDMRTVLRVLAAVLAMLALPVAVGAATAATTFGSLYTPRDDGDPPAAPAAAVLIPHDPAKPTAVVVVGERGAAVSDVLAPYEVLAASHAFNVYTVAPQRRPLTLTGGLDLVPDLTFAELDHRLAGAAPELVVVPAMRDVGEPTHAPVTTWLRRQAERGTLLLSVCNGSRVLAAAGLLDGRNATAHWIRIDGFADQFPTVNWVRGPRYVDDGNIVSTAGILSGIDGTLWAIQRLAGPATAVKAAAAVGWQHYAPDEPAPATPSGFGLADSVVVLNAAYRWDPSTIGVMLTDGVGEIELSSVFDTYAAQALAARTVAVADTTDTVRTRHGLTFAPRSDLRSAAPNLDRLIVPGADAARHQDVDPAGFRGTPEYLHERPSFAFDAAVTDLARTTDVATAQWTARMLEYPTNGIELAGSPWPWSLTLRPIALALAGLAIAIGIDHLCRARRRSRSTSRHTETPRPERQLVETTAH